MLSCLLTQQMSCYYKILANKQLIIVRIQCILVKSTTLFFFGSQTFKLLQANFLCFKIFPVACENNMTSTAQNQNHLKNYFSEYLQYSQSVGLSKCKQVVVSCSLQAFFQQVIDLVFLNFSLTINAHVKKKTSLTIIVNQTPQNSNLTGLPWRFFSKGRHRLQ